MIEWLPSIFVGIMGFLSISMVSSFTKSVDNLNNSVNELNRTVSKLGERVSHIEGKIN